jgi:UDP-glucose 4-epimerase
MNYLITGGAGFIGTHLTARLLSAGDEVFIIDDLSTGKKENLDSIGENPRLHLFVDSVTNEALLSELVEKCEVVFHLAAVVGVKLVAENPLNVLRTNIYGAELLLSSAARFGRKVVLTSSSEVYGKSDDVPLKEDGPMVFDMSSTTWSYAFSKLIDEFLALKFHREKGLPVVITRLFNVVGPGQVGDYGMVIPRFMQQAASGGPIIVYDDGSQTRSFTYVGDVAEALIQLADCDEAAGGIFNIGSEDPISINELAQRVRRLVNPRAEIKHIPFSEVFGSGRADIRHRVPDISRIKKVIGFKPTLNIDGILEKILEDLKKTGRI